MDQPRTTSDLMNEAHRRASRQSPPPEWHPVTAGLAWAAVFVVPMILFASVSVGVSLYALILNAAVGFGIGLFWAKRRRDAYYRAWNRELTALRGTSETWTPQTTDARLPQWLTRRDTEPR